MVKKPNESLSVFKAKSKCDNTEYPLTNVSFLLLFVQIFSNLYLIIKYNIEDYSFEGSNLFAIQNLTFLIFSVFGILLNRSISKKFNVGNFQGKYVISALITFIGIAIVQFFFITITKISISQFDLFLFYGSTAISEEFLFRYGIQTATEDLFAYRIRILRNSTSCNIVSSILSIFIASFFFGIYHYFVKGGDIGLVLAVFGSGVILGIALRVWKSIDVCLIAHFMLNATIILGEFI